MIRQPALAQPYPRPVSSLRRPPTPMGGRLWLLFGATFIFFAFSPFRLQLGFLGDRAPINFAPPVIVLLLIFASNVAFNPKGSASAGSAIGIPGSLLFALVAYHYVSALTAANVVLALRDASKLLMGVLFMCGIVKYFPNDGRLLARVWTCVIWGSAAVFAALIYQYAVVFRAPSLGANFSEETREMRNQLTWYLVFVFPVAISYLLLAGRMRVIRVLPVVVLAVAWVYAGSRNAWISVCIGALSVVPLVVRVSGRKLLLIGVATVVLFAAVAWTWSGVTDRVRSVEAIRRLQYLYDPEAVPELRTCEDRMAQIRSGLTMFATSPVFGVGLTNGPETHNDYARIIGELGFLGTVLFAVVTWVGLRRIWPLRRAVGVPILWVSVGTRMTLIAVLVSLFGINGYNSPLVWSFLGLAFALRHIEITQPVPTRLGRPVAGSRFSSASALQPTRRAI